MKNLLFYFMILFYINSNSQNNVISNYYITPTAISNRSPSVLQYTQSLKYCSDLVEAGYSDWRLPKLQEIEKYLFAGGNIPGGGITTWVRGGFTPGPVVSGGTFFGIVYGYIFTVDSSGSGQVYSVIESQNSSGFSGPIGTNFCHCVR
jgi:hypothetical protein